MVIRVSVAAVFLLIVSLLVQLHPAYAEKDPRPFKNLARIANEIGFRQYRTVVTGRTLKVAILDNGFKGYEAEIGKTLPAGTRYHEGPTKPDTEEEMHGLAMAQILSGLLKEANPVLDYELHLFSAYGYTNLKKAVETVSRENYDVVLYSQVWEYGGNGDGRGFINQLVNKAAQNGVIWINASGNFGDSTYRGPIKRGADDWAQLPGKNEGVAIRCQKNSSNKCQLRVVLTWNDFSDDPDVGTDKDLDLVLTDDTLKVVQTSGLTQVKKVTDGMMGASLYPREIIQAEIKPGLYYLRVKVRSQNFGAKDEMRLLLKSDFVKMEGATPGETILAPADNENVITVGAADSEKSSSSKLYGKPELLTPSAVVTAKNETFKGSSNSATITAAAVTLLKAAQPQLTRARVISLLGFRGQSNPSPGVDTGSPSGLPLDLLRFGPTDDGCFRLINLPYYPTPLRAISRMTNLYFVRSTAGPKIFTTVDPLELINEVGVRLDRYNDDDMIVVDSNGFTTRPRSNQDYLEPGLLEVVQIPEGQGICRLTGAPGPGEPAGARLLRLPDPSSLQ